MKEKIDSVQGALKDRYQLMGILGEGGASIVYKALDLRLNSLVAIKVLHNDPQGLGAARLQREAQTSARLQNSNIARVFNFAQAPDGTSYMVMEMLEGIGLDKLILERKFLDWQEAVGIFRQICNGLVHAHKHGVVHRDLKPSNVVLLKEKDHWQIKILDFGIAKIESDQKLTTKGSILGSPSYMSPEQVTALDVDARSDIYSLGCLMFETLTGSLPFKGASSIETFAMHKNQAPPLVSDEIDGTPPLLVELVDKCLRKRPEDRPQTADEINNILDEIVNGPIIDYSNETVIPSQQEFKKGFPLKVIAIFLAVALLGFGIEFTRQIWFSPAKPVRSRIEPGNAMEEAPAKPEVAFDAMKYRVYWQGQKIIREGGEDTDDETMQSLQLVRVDSFRIMSTQVTGVGFRYLKGMKIGTISIQKSSIKPENLVYLKDLPNIHELLVQSPYLNDRALAHISNIKTLNTLAIGTGKYSKAGFEQLTKLSQLNSLTLNGIDASDEDLEPICRIPNLAVVRMINCPNVSPDIGIMVAKLPKLKTVFINRSMSSASYRALSGTQIKALNLTGRSIDHKEFNDICKLKSLFRLCLNQAEVADDDYSSLSKLPKLARLELSGMPVISKSLWNTVTKLKLNILDCSASGLKFEQLLKLLSMPSLTTLDIDKCNKITLAQKTEFLSRFALIHRRNLNQMSGEKEKTTEHFVYSGLK